MARSKAVKIVVGCLGAAILLVVIAVAAVGIAIWSYRSGLEETARNHAGLFLSHVQRADHEAALDAAEYAGGSRSYTREQFRQCITATVLADISSYQCTDVEGGMLLGDGGDVTCTVVTPQHGPQEITIHVNNLDGSPYLGFVWFSPGAWMGDAWRGDSCARWSGQRYFREPPAGRVRP